MSADPDRDPYEFYYAEKLWRLLPEVYRAADSSDFDCKGPLLELVERLSAQGAILRRSIDRLWEDQSIESCDDWVIPYLADLLATNLVGSMDARGQRLDVGRTIYYRRRKGTVALLEELTHDCTGWDVRCVEFFRRMARSRHGLDPAIGRPADTGDPVGERDLQVAQGLVGLRTGTPAGGFADLRNAAGARRSGSPFDASFQPEPRGSVAFDEFFHTADVRRGQGNSGWYNIPRLGFFLWRLRSFGLELTTPVEMVGCPGPRQFTVDPTGRDLPLFAASNRTFGDAWVSPEEWQLPGAIPRDLLAVALADLYDTASLQNLAEVSPRSLGVYRLGGALPDLIPVEQITADPDATTAAFRIAPEQGRLLAVNDPGGNILVTYHTGFSSPIGAGAFDRLDAENRLPAVPGTPTPVVGGGNSLVAPLNALNGSKTGSIVVNDSLTYTTVADLAKLVDVSLRARSYSRPVVRPAVGTTWRFEGAATDSRLVLTGLLLSGCDVVLEGHLGDVFLSCCTLDPGTKGTPPNALATAADNRLLTPCRLLIAGEVRSLLIDRWITGPVMTTGQGHVERVTICESVVQALGTDRALSLPDAAVRLSRCTILGAAEVHRIDASECILHDLFTAADVQHGCVRFSAYAEGSTLPRPYESVQIAPRQPLFVSRRFGDPWYARLLDGIDASIASGAEDGSEMGSFAREKTPIKMRSLLIKLAEFMPLGLAPVLIPVT